MGQKEFLRHSKNYFSLLFGDEKEKAMIEKIQLLWSYIIDEGIEFTRDLNIAGAIAVSGLYALSLLQWITLGTIPNILSLLGIIIVVIVVIRLVSISKVIGITIFGEIAEIVGAVESRPGPDNKLLRLYYNIVVQILISLAIMTIVLPRIPMGNAWWLWMVWPTILLIFAVVLGSQDGKKIRAIGLIVFLMVVVYTVNTTWPNLWKKTTSLPHSIGDSFISPEEKEERELTSQGWQELEVSAPDKDGFVSPITPGEAIGKTTVLFKESTVIATRANGGTPLKFNNVKILNYSEPIQEGWLPDLKFKTQRRRRWVKFR